MTNGGAGEEGRRARIVDESEPDAGRSDESLVVRMLESTCRRPERASAQRGPVGVANPSHRSGEPRCGGVLPRRRRAGMPAQRGPVPGRAMAVSKRESTLERGDPLVGRATTAMQGEGGEGAIERPHPCRFAARHPDPGSLGVVGESSRFGCVGGTGEQERCTGMGVVDA